MNKINLMGNLGPLTKKPKDAKKKILDKKPPEIRTITWCGCGSHPIDPKKDRYAQHNNWMAQFHPESENGRRDIRGVKGLTNINEPSVPSYDFSGEEFEVTNEELRKFKK